MNLVLIISMFFICTTKSFNLNKFNYRIVREINMKKSNSYINIINSIYKPRNDNQNKYVNYLNNNYIKLVIASGSAGTGKTLFACLKGITMLKNNEIQKIIITRPAVSVEEEHGFLPGNINKKMDPWMRPILDIFDEFYSKNEIELMLKNGIIEISPLAYMRGRTFKNTFIIGDEMQNSSPNQMMMLTTRLGINSKLVLTGDLKQSDKISNNGLKDLLMRVKNYNNSNLVKYIEFNDEDIERSEIVREIINIYNFNDDKNTILPKVKNINITNNIVNKSKLSIIPISNERSFTFDNLKWNNNDIIEYLKNFNAKPN